MSKLFKILSLFIFVCFVVIAGFYLHYLQNQKEQNIKKYFDFNSELMSKSLENERANSLAIAILLSKNSNIISCYQKQNHEYCMDVAKDFVGILSQVPSYKNINIHMHNAQTQSLARSWDENKFGDNLSGFRYMLNDIKRNMQPVAGIEVGRCGIFMRGIAPVFVDKKFQGSIEVMLDFSQLETIAKSQGLNIFILLNKSFESDCIYNTGENSIKNYYILNPNVNNMNILPNLRRFDFENLNFAKFGSSYFYSKVLRDVSNNKVGYIILYYNDDLITTSRLDLIIH